MSFESCGCATRLRGDSCPKAGTSSRVARRASVGGEARFATRATADGRGARALERGAQCDGLTTCQIDLRELRVSKSIQPCILGTIAGGVTKLNVKSDCTGWRTWVVHTAHVDEADGGWRRRRGVVRPNATEVVM